MENKALFLEHLFNGAREIGLYLNDSQLDRFLSYADLLVEWNEKINLTALTGWRDIIQKHFLDSLTLANYIPSGIKLADVGTGAGFPGVPLKIAVPDIQVVLMDSTKKKLTFLDEVTAKLGLTKTITAHTRAEEAGRGKYREKFDAVVSRAVSRLDRLSEICLPLIKVEGAFIAMKGPNVDDELKEAVDVIEKMNGRVDFFESKNLPRPDGGYEEISRSLIMIKKFRQTPAKYPRSSAELARIYKKDL